MGSGHPTFASSFWPRIRQVIVSVLDQGLSVGGMFLVNIALARVQTKEAYGVFALSYTVLTFLTGLHNAALLETFTVYGSGRYAQRFPEYAWLLWRANSVVAVGLSVVLVVVWGGLHIAGTRLASKTFLGMACACGILLSASFIRRTMYMRRRPDLAARFSATFFFLCVALLSLAIRAKILDGFSAFAIAAVAWVIAGMVFSSELPRKAGKNFSDTEGNYWSEHWKYSRWVFVTALVFQLTTQAYYWLAAGFLSVKDVANLRAMYNLVTPIDQLFVAVALLVIPMMSHKYSVQGLAGLVPLLKRYVLLFIVVTGAFAVLVRIFGRPLLHVLYGGRFDDVAALVGTFALLPVLMGIGNAINAALKAMEKPSSVFWAYAASGTATILVGLPLLLHFGLSGAVNGMLLSAGVYSSTLLVAFWLACRAPVSRVPASAFISTEGCSLSPEEILNGATGEK
jgi:O-antigen/teichoic acid export membrane protein